jgi:short-subunit dehydrogenase
MNAKLVQKIKLFLRIMNSFTNKVVWITGASSGIGEALAKCLAKENAKVILSARNKAELDRVQQEAGLNDSNSLVLQLDLSETKLIGDHVSAVIKKFGRIDVLINNGGISQRATAAQTNLDTDRQIMEINYFGTVAITKAVLPYLIAQESGQIVVISSIAGKFGFYLRSSYSASKHALHGFFESLRMEIYKKNIKVLIVCPGKVRTKISQNALKGDGSKHQKADEATEKGISAESCAAQIIHAIRKGKEEIFVGGKELRAVWVKRLFPNLFSKLIRKQKPE